MATFIVGDDTGEAVGGSTPLQVQVTIDEVGDQNGDGFDDLQVTLQVVSGFTADLRGFFFNVSDDSVLSNLSITGTHVNGFEVDTDGDGIPEISDAAPPNPEAEISPLAFEAGVELGTPGIGDDDISSTSFIISAAGTDLTAALLAGQEIGIRAQSVGDDREGSSKLTGTVPENGGQPETGSISGTKYADLDESGTISGADDGVAGWDISLYRDFDNDDIPDPDELVGTTTTDADGNYLFDDLVAGSYIVVEEDRADWTHVTASELPVELAEGQDSTDNDFLNRQEEEQETGSISGTKYADLDESGTITGADDGVAGWEISLYSDDDGDDTPDPGELVETTTTDADGNYLFDDLNAGSYIVVEEDRGGWTHVTASELPVELAEGENSTGNDFLNRQEEGEEETPGFEFDKDIDTAVSTDIDFDTDIDFSKDFDADIDVTADADLDGNLSTLTLDAEAVGTDTLVEADASVLTVENQLSSVNLSVISAIA